MIFIKNFTQIKKHMLTFVVPRASRVSSWGCCSTSSHGSY